MKVCLISDSIDPKCGLGRMVTSIAEELQSRGHDIGFIVASGESDNGLLKINFRFLGSKFYKNIADLFRVRNFVNKFDVIICYDVNPAGLIAHFATLFRKDLVIIHSIGTYSLFPRSGGLRGRVKRSLMRFVYKNSYQVWVINDFVKKQIEKSSLGFLFTNDANIVPVGVDTKLFKKSKNTNNKYGDEYIISVGALKERKAQLDSIMAFNSIKESYPKLKYLLVGSTKDSVNYYNKILSYIKDNNLEDRVVLIQDVTDSELINLYSGARFFILTPRSTPESIEGFGMVYIEAALCGLTSVGTLNTGAEAAINNRETGILVKQGSIPEIASAMSTLLENSDLRNRLQASAYNRALKFDWKFVVDLYEKEFKKLSI